MPKQTTTVERPWTGREFKIPKIANDVLYVCLNIPCKGKIMSEAMVNSYRGGFSNKDRCPVCNEAMYKVIK